MARSLETNWLANIDKSLSRPEVVYLPTPTIENGAVVGGYYIRPNLREYLIDGLGYDGRFGIIVVGTSWGQKQAQSTLAHEWRHHWQLHHGMVFDNLEWKEEHTLDWKASIRRYFTSSKTEMDALLFEHKMVKDANEAMMSAVFSSMKVKKHG